jgi:flagellar biosynthesis GTPase FlhF
LAILNTKNERKSFIITSVIYVLLILLLLLTGLSYYDPPKQKGIAVNFGTMDTGSGDVQPDQPVKTAPTQQSTPKPQEQAQPETAEAENEEVVTQDTEDAPVMPDEDKEKTEKKPEKEPEEETKETEEIKEETEEAEETQPEPVEKEPEKEVVDKEPEPKPDETTNEALDNVLNAPKNEGEADQGEGDNTTGGDKGDPDGDKNAKSYYGTGKGDSGDGNYRLGGREALQKTKYVQDCNETGRVVVRIEVNRQGQVIAATPGVKGTTNNADCLTDPAKRAALDTKFNADQDAPPTQVGYITYRFKLSE